MIKEQTEEPNEYGPSCGILFVVLRDAVKVYPAHNGRFVEFIVELQDISFPGGTFKDQMYKMGQDLTEFEFGRTSPFPIPLLKWHPNTIRNRTLAIRLQHHPRAPGIHQPLRLHRKTTQPGHPHSRQNQRPIPRCPSPNRSPRRGSMGETPPRRHRSLSTSIIRNRRRRGRGFLRGKAR